MTEQQQHLKNLLQQRASLQQQINKNKELFWKVQGIIEYLVELGVTLPESKPEEESSQPEEESSQSEEETKKTSK